MPTAPPPFSEEASDIRNKSYGYKTEKDRTTCPVCVPRLKQSGNLSKYDFPLLLIKEVSAAGRRFRQFLEITELHEILHLSELLVLCH